MIWSDANGFATAVFIEEAGGVARSYGIETDKYDSLCDHVLIEDSTGEVVCSFRILYAASGADVAASYSATILQIWRRLAE